MVTRRVHLSFPRERVREPVIYNLGKRFDLVTNIRRASIENDAGWVVLEISGEPDNLERGFDYLGSLGVHVDPVERDVVEG